MLFFDVDIKYTSLIAVFIAYRYLQIDNNMYYRLPWDNNFYYRVPNHITSHPLPSYLRPFPAKDRGNTQVLTGLDFLRGALQGIPGLLFPIPEKRDLLKEAQ